MNNHVENDNEGTPTYALISFADAVKYMGNSLILCDKIVEIDEYIFENCELCNVDEEFYQYYLTDCTKDDAERLRAWFGLNFLYSEKLDLYILCVEHLGTSLDYVPCEVYNKDIADNMKRLGMEFKH